ncbi:MAG TPA: hypothetical protein VD788_17925, partial [Candidatus Polarisedimenticolaceae bacterium]|nr:hypothetical protein [Candidatus Polarisedimenticolaceae bacterium]
WRRWCEIDAPYEAASIKVKLADALLAGGDERAARLHLSAALAVFDRLGARLDAGRARERLARQPDPAPRSAERARAWAFVEIVGFDRLAAALGAEGWSDFEGWLKRILGNCCIDHGGSPVPSDPAGSFGAEFSRAEDAVRCGVHIQRSLREHRARHGFAPPIRAGIVEGAADDGIDRARELAARAATGEILTSRAIAERCDYPTRALVDPPETVRVLWQDASGARSEKG